MGCQNGKMHSKKLNKIEELVQNLTQLQKLVSKVNSLFIMTKSDQVDQQVLEVMKYINSNNSNMSSTQCDDVNKQLQIYVIQMKEYQVQAKNYLTHAIKYIGQYRDIYSQNILFINLSQLVEKFQNFAFSLELVIYKDNSKKSTLEDLGDLCQSEIIC